MHCAMQHFPLIDLAWMRLADWRGRLLLAVPGPNVNKTVCTAMRRCGNLGALSIPPRVALRRGRQLEVEQVRLDCMRPQYAFFVKQGRARHPGSPGQGSAGKCRHRP